MSKKITVDMSSGGLGDAMHSQGANFLPNILFEFSKGNIVEIKLVNNVINFDSADEFAAWFLVDRLRSLHLQLESQGEKGDDWSAARNLEDAIGARQASQNQIMEAQTLLAGHNK